MARRPISKVSKGPDGLIFEGVIDHQTIPRLIAALPAESGGDMVLDLSAVSRIDSAGLAFLIFWNQQQAKPAEKIRLKGVDVQARQLIETLKLGAIFELQTQFDATAVSTDIKDEVA